MKIGTTLSLTLSIFGVLLIHSVAFSSATDYCSASLCGTSKHIACSNNNNNGALSRSCMDDAKVETLTTNIKTAIVNKHNEFRNTIAKGGFSGFTAASRMATMKWNDELARIAEFNVKQCAIKHDACRNTDAFKYAGQNLAYSGWSGTTKTIQDVAVSAVQMWFNEYKDCKMAQINSYANPPSGAVIGHFTQIVQDKATDVGCAILRQTKNGLIEQYTACNYARTNILNRPVYVTAATAASQCTTGVNSSYKYLCSLEEAINANAI